MITDIKKYLAPLTNNERGILYAAAHGRSMTSGWVERTQSVEADLTKYRSGKRIPDGQKDKAIMGLVEKGYATIRPRRGNYVNRTGFWVGCVDGGSVWLTRKSAPMHQILTEKMNGSKRWERISLWRLVEVIPVEDVQGAIMEYREQQDNAERLEVIARAQKASLKQTQLEAKMLRLCEQYVREHTNSSPYADERDEYNRYPMANIIGEIELHAKEMDRWVYRRQQIERDAKHAQEQMA